ncbi:MAG: hypothetical protein EOP86_27045 [Verrucomicrobiaceae bacterium]|nr:MAG: hypothetical protein EOP86_27045 [Verrucomicrobiaceae bacterium]
MQLQNISPGWARVVIVPAILGFLVSGGWLMVAGMRNAQADGSVAPLLAFLPGLFMVYLAWRGLPLARSLGFLAAISGDSFHYRRATAAPLEAVPLADLKVTWQPAMQLVVVKVASTGQHLFTADYVYRHASALAREIQAHQDSEGGKRPQAVDPAG